MTTPTEDTSKIVVGEVTYDISTNVGALEYVIAMAVSVPSLMADDVLLALNGLRMIGWDNETIANTIKERVKANAKAILKDVNKIDHVKRFVESVKIKIGGKNKTHEDVISTINALIAAANAELIAYNTANPDANLQPYSLSGGKPKSKAGGKGEGRSYHDLALLLNTHKPLWGDKTQLIEYGARKLVYPIVIENTRTMIQYTGVSSATFIDTRDKDEKKDEHAVGKLARNAKGDVIGRIKKCDLVNAKLYPISMLNQLNTWANGAALDDDGKPKPSAAPNSWINCTLDGIVIPDGITKKTIENPTIAEFYDQYLATLDNDPTVDGGEQAPTE